MSPNLLNTGLEQLPVRAGRILCRWLGRLLAVVGLVTILVVFTPLVSWWVQAYSGPIERPKGDILIVLSAAADDNGGISYSSYWRARYAVLAWQTGGFKEILIAGNSGPGIVHFLTANGIPREAIFTESQSLSTRENGLAIARLLQNMPGRKVLLTSDFHIYRAIRVFRKLGMDVAPMAVPDLLQMTRHWFGRFRAFTTMLDESAKISYYRIRGWI